jgi:hypothetical protein
MVWGFVFDLHYFGEGRCDVNDGQSLYVECGAVDVDGTRAN